MLQSENKSFAEEFQLNIRIAFTPENFDLHSSIDAKSTGVDDSCSQGLVPKPTSQE
jgi:hypothetical protein